MSAVATAGPALAALCECRAGAGSLTQPETRCDFHAGWDEADAHLRRDVAGTVSSALGDEGPAGSVTEAEARVREGYVRLREGLEQLEGSVTDTRELREALAELEVRQRGPGQCCNGVCCGHIHPVTSLCLAHLQEDMARSLGSLAELGVPADAMLADMAAHSAESRRELRDMLQESAGAVQGEKMPECLGHASVSRK